MPLTEKAEAEFQARRAERLAAASKGAKSAGQVGAGLSRMAMGPTRVGYFHGGNMTKALKVQCKRLAGRSTVVGNTVFVFDTDGVSSTPDAGNARDDYEALLRLNGMVRLDADGAPVASDHAFPEGYVDQDAADAAAVAAAGALVDHDSPDAPEEHKKSTQRFSDTGASSDTELQAEIDAEQDSITEPVTAEEQHKKSPRRNPHK